MCRRGNLSKVQGGDRILRKGEVYINIFMVGCRSTVVPLPQYTRRRSCASTAWSYLSPSTRVRQLSPRRTCGLNSFLRFVVNVKLELLRFVVNSKRGLKDGTLLSFVSWTDFSYK